MQNRSSNISSRTVIMVCVVIVLIVGVLYFMKKVEANRLGAELDMTKTDRKEREEDLNGKLTDYLRKMEEMTKQLGDLQAKLKKSEDEAANSLSELQTVKKAVTLCQDQQSMHIEKMGSLEDELQDLKDVHHNINEKLTYGKSEVVQLQQSLRDSETELSACKDQSILCQNTLTTCNHQHNDARTLLATCEQQKGVANPGKLPYIHPVGAYKPQEGRQPQQQVNHDVPKPNFGFNNVGNNEDLNGENGNQEEVDDDKDKEEVKALGEANEDEEDYKDEDNEN